MHNRNQKKTVLLIGGHDPSGGAGIQADIESIAHAGCQATSIITVLTAQNTQRVTIVSPQKPKDMREQFRLIQEDIKIDACKIGVLGHPDLIEVIYEELSDKNIPIVLDPITHAGSGKRFANKLVCKKIISLLIPITTILTPNSMEAKILTNEKNLDNAGQQFIAKGAKAVLITGKNEESMGEVINSLYLDNGNRYDYSWERLPNVYHGSGCTLSSRIAARIALGDNLKSATEEAQQYTWDTLRHGFKLGRKQYHPNRFFDQQPAKNILHDDSFS